MKYIGCLLVAKLGGICHTEALVHTCILTCRVLLHILDMGSHTIQRDGRHSVVYCVLRGKINFVHRVAANELEKAFHLNYHSNYMLNNVCVLVDMLDIDCFLGPMY